jgi:hypothetical protein
MLDKQMIDEELFFAQAVFLVDPEFVHGDEPEAEVLAEVREFLVDPATDIPAVHDPNRGAPNLIEFFDIWLLHGSRPLIP